MPEQYYPKLEPGQVLHRNIIGRDIYIPTDCEWAVEEIEMQNNSDYHPILKTRVHYFKQKKDAEKFLEQMLLMFEPVRGYLRLIEL